MKFTDNLKTSDNFLLNTIFGRSQNAGENQMTSDLAL